MGYEARHWSVCRWRWAIRKGLAPACLVLLLAACAGEASTVTPSPAATSSPTATVPAFDERDLPADIADVLLSGPTIVDAGPRFATLVAESNVDLVCAVAYGPTTDYGQIATDRDMAGGGHSDHHPLLTGLEPDTLYHYRLGGLGPDGTVYRSDDLTFRTPPESEVDDQQPSDGKVALSVIGVSSNFGGGDNDSVWGANNAIDGDINTQWSSDGDGDDAWINLQLFNETYVTSLGFWTRTMGTSAQVHSFRVVTDLGETYGPFTLNDAAAVHYFTVDFRARRLRFEAIDTSGGNTGAVEIEVYGEPVI